MPCECALTDYDNYFNRERLDYIILFDDIEKTVPELNLSLDVNSTKVEPFFTPKDPKTGVYDMPFT